MIKIGLRSGGYISYDKDVVDVSMLQLSDIAYGLANMQRFCGQIDRPYSNAEHSCILAEIDTPGDWDAKIADLFHDSAEPLGIGDVCAFLKPKELKKTEDKFLAAVFKKFNVPKFTSSELDKQLGNYEAANIHPAKQHFPTEIKLPARFRHWGVSDAASRWMTALQYYMESREFATKPLNIGQAKVGVPFDLPIITQIDPLAVEKALLLNPAVSKVGGRYVVSN